MALLAFVHNKLVDQDKAISNHLFTNLISISSFLPGPVAVNVVSSIGYSTNGLMGAFVAFFAVLLPSFIVMTCLYFFYEYFNESILLKSFFNGVTYIIVGIILSVSYNMIKKEKLNLEAPIIILAVLVLLFFFHSFWQLLLIIVLTGGTGWMLNYNSYQSIYVANFRSWIWIIPICFAAIFYFLPHENIYLDLLSTFSTVSVSLFGGGYVMIPMLQDIVVNQKQWLTQQEFIDSIAMGQFTPGPILISAAFVGFKQAGFLGGVVATLAIFVPSSILMLVVYNGIRQWLENRHFKAFFDGLRLAVIAMIIYSGLYMFMGLKYDSWFTIMTIIAIYLIVFHKMSPIYLILFGGFFGIIRQLIVF